MLSDRVVGDDTALRLQAAAAQFMAIEDTTVGDGQSAPYSVRFRGRLKDESQQAYAIATEAFGHLGHTPLFRSEHDRDVVLAMPGLVRPRASRVWINAVLLMLTVASVLLTGADYSHTGPLPETGAEWLAFFAGGLPFLLSMLGILMAHELGHYFAARYHKVVVSLPYFIPFPLSPFGTLGAFIQLKSPPTNRRVLLDIGLAGPIAGLLVAVPVLLYGLWTSPLEPIPAALPAGQAIAFEGNSVVYVLSKWLVFGRLLPEPASFGGIPPLMYMLRYYLLGMPVPMGGTDVMLNSVAWAGWAGLLVTGLNLIPAGQLDGGHALYVLIGRKARLVRPFIILALLALGFVWEGWFLWAAIVFFLGRVHAEPLDQITRLDGPRVLLAISGLVLFLLVITPVPLIIVQR
jgi:hypothetical protein